jgi:hypothetical protein
VNNRNCEEKDVKYVIDQLKAKININDARHVGRNVYKVTIDLKTNYYGGAISVGNKIVAMLKPEMDST